MKIYAWVLLGMASVSAAHAAESVRGFYAGAGIGKAELTLENADSASDFEADDVSYRVLAGYRFFRYFAVEATYSDYGKPRDTFQGFDLVGDFHAFGASAVGLIPFERAHLELFGKLGFGAWEGKFRVPRFGIETSENNVDPLVGFGLQYRAGNLTIRGEAEGQALGFDDDGDGESDNDDVITNLSVSVIWNF